jgi:predicted dehydrogenase
MVASSLTSVVIGCGMISEQHLKFISASPAVDLVGVCDLSPARAAWTAERFDTTAFTDHREMLAAAEPQTVHVLTPPVTHVALALDALDAGAHVVVEKPAASSAPELRDLLAHATTRGLIVVENQNYRFNDGVLRLREAIGRGDLGEVVGLDVAIALDLTMSPFADSHAGNPVGHLAGGAVRDLLPHQVGLAVHLLDGPYRAGGAAWANRSGIDELVADELDGSFELGSARVRVSFSSAAHPERFRVEARGTRGSMTVDLWQPSAFLAIPRGPAQLTGVVNQLVEGASLARAAFVNLYDKLRDRGPYHGVPRLLDGFYAAAAGLDGAPVSADDMMRTARIVDDLAIEAPTR